MPLLLIAAAPRADTVEEINAKSLNILVYLKNQVEGSEAFLKQAAGVDNLDDAFIALAGESLEEEEEVEAVAIQ